MQGEAQAAALRAADAMQRIVEVEVQREDFRLGMVCIQAKLTGAKGDNALLTAQVKVLSSTLLECMNVCHSPVS